MAYIKSRKKACEECGSTTSLTFHHLDPTEKSFTIANASNERHIVGFRKLKREIDKCKVLCDSCHRKVEKAKRRYSSEEEQPAHTRETEGSSPSTATKD